jgi:hypothetical protein
MSFTIGLKQDLDEKNRSAYYITLDNNEIFRKFLFIFYFKILIISEVF